MKWKLAAVAATAIVAAGVATPVLMAGAASTPAPLCRTSDVSFYYGGAFAGLGRRSFDITLLAHDGVRCRLSDRPLITLTAKLPKHKVKVSVGGRGGKLLITPDLPLHTTVQYYAPDRPQNTTMVHSLTLHMPGGGIANPQPFQYPGDIAIARNIGVSITSWTTGIGLGQEYGAY